MKEGNTPRRNKSFLSLFKEIIKNTVFFISKGFSYLKGTLLRVLVLFKGTINLFPWALDTIMRENMQNKGFGV